MWVFRRGSSPRRWAGGRFVIVATEEATENRSTFLARIVVCVSRCGLRYLRAPLQNCDQLTSVVGLDPLEVEKAGAVGQGTFFRRCDLKVQLDEAVTGRKLQHLERHGQEVDLSLDALDVRVQHDARPIVLRGERLGAEDGRA